MSNATINKKTFNLVLNKTKTFILRMSNFTITTALRVLISISTINLDITVKQLLNSTISMSVKTIGLSFVSKMNLLVSPLISLGTIGLTFVTKALTRFTTTIDFKIPISMTAKFLLKNILSVSSGKVNLVLTPIVAIFIYLSELDPQLLNVLDVQTLADLDAS